MRYLIKDKGCDPMSRDEDDWTVLHKAAYDGQLKIVQCLIDEFGVDPKSCRNTCSCMYFLPVNTSVVYTSWFSRLGVWTKLNRSVCRC